MSRLQIASIPLAQANSGRDGPLSLDEAEISGGIVNLAGIQIKRGPDQPEMPWSGGREKGGGQFAASFRQLHLTDGIVSFNDTEIAYGLFSFDNADFLGGVLDFGDSKLEDCCLDFAGAKINGGYLNFSNSYIGARSSKDVDPRGGFAYEWLEDLKNAKDVSSRDMNRKRRPYSVVTFWSAGLGSGHVNFDGATARGVFLQFSGIRASGGEIALTGAEFEALVISFWRANLSGECEIEIRSRHHGPFSDVAVLYGQACGGLNDRVVLGERIQLLEVSDVD